MEVKLLPKFSISKYQGEMEIIKATYFHLRRKVNVHFVGIWNEEKAKEFVLTHYPDLVMNFLYSHTDHYGGYHMATFSVYSKKSSDGWDKLSARYDEIKNKTL